MKIFSQTGALPCVFGPAVELQGLPQQTQTPCKREIYSGYEPSCWARSKNGSSAVAYLKTKSSQILVGEQQTKYRRTRKAVVCPRNLAWRVSVARSQLETTRSLKCLGQKWVKSTIFRSFVSWCVSAWPIRAGKTENRKYAGHEIQSLVERKHRS